MKNLPNINFKVIPHKSHRYDTVGDYFKKGKDWEFRVSKTNSDYEFLVLIHELVEWYLTQRRGIKEIDIKKFDIMFEKEREEGKHDDDDEPGHDPRAPYLKEHIFSEFIERNIAEELDIDWSEYDNTIISL